MFLLLAGVAAALPGLSKDGLAGFARTLVIAPDVEHRTPRALRMAHARCVALAHGGVPDLLPAHPVGRPV